PRIRVVSVGLATPNSYPFTLTHSASARLSPYTTLFRSSGLSVGGLSMPLTLAPGQKTSFSVVFAPASTGNMTGSVSLVSNALNSTTTIALIGTGVHHLQPQLSVVPPSARFEDVRVGPRTPQTITLINSDTAKVSISHL